MFHVWDGSDWKNDSALKVWNGSSWQKVYKFKVRDSVSWLPRSVSDQDDAVIIRWTTEAPTPPPPPPPVTHPVPDIDLKTLQEVETLLDPLNFTYSVTGYEVTNTLAYDDKVVIDSQFPAAGEQLAEGSQVTFKLYNYVTPQTTVPNLNNLLKSAAETAITNANLVVGTPLATDETYDTTLIGRVITGSQYPSAGSTVDVGTSVIFDYWVQKPYATVPNLVGLNENNIFTPINNANLVLGTRTVFNTADATLDGKVKSTFPVAGTQVQQGTSVNYEVYDHTLTVVPNLNGLTQAQAETALQNAGLYVGTISNQETTVVADEGKVKNNSQAPSAGATVTLGGSVNFTTWVPNTTIAVPNILNMNGFTASQLLQDTYELYLSIRNITYTNDTNLQYKIYWQSPNAGTVVNVWSTVQCDMYFPYPTYTVPSIIGLTPQSSGTAIDSNFTWGSNTLANTSTETTGNFGKVATQFPYQGNQAQAQAINYGIYVDGRPTVPNVVGQTEATAKTNITNAGLNWSVSYQNQTYNGQATAGTVASQTPASGTRLASGGTVSIVVWNAYTPQPVTRTGYVYIGWSGDIGFQWQASYRDTLANQSGVTDGGLRTTSAPYYVGYFDTTNAKQHHAFHFDWTSFDNRAKVVSGNASYTITGVELRYWINGSSGNANAKSLRVGSYPSMVSSAPSVMRESDINTRGLVLSASTRGTYAYVNLNATLLSDVFTYPNYPCVVYAPNTSLDNYLSNDSDVRFTVTIQWTEYV
jgi:beta-lactam-binding protein with PASTA domain